MPELTKLFHDTVPALQSLLLLDQKKNRFELSGPGYLIQEAGGYQLRVSHLSFFQVNRFLLEDLLRTVIADAKGDLALDLYAGVGFFTLPLTKTFLRVVSVDANLSATRDLRENADTADTSIVSQHLQTEEFLKTATEAPDFVVLDPPRAGLGQTSAQKLAEPRPQGNRIPILRSVDTGARSGDPHANVPQTGGLHSKQTSLRNYLNGFLRPLSSDLSHRSSRPVTARIGNEAAGRCPRERFCLWHRDLTGALANRASCGDLFSANSARRCC